MSTTPQWQLHPIAPGAGLGLHRAHWDRLNRQLMAGHAMLDGAFVDGLLQNFNPDGVLLAVATAGPHPIAMLLLSRRPRGLGVWSGFQPAQTQVGLTLLPPTLDLQGLFAVLPGLAGELDLMCNDPRFGDLRDHAGRTFSSLPHALTMNVVLRGSFDDYWAQRPRNLIKNIRRYSRRLSEEGGRRLDVIQQPEDMAAAIERYGQLESSGWKGRQGTAIHAQNPQGHFYREIMTSFAARGEALVYELWTGDQLIASRLLITSGGMAIILKTSYNEAYDRFAPGRLLLMNVLEDLFVRMPGGVVEFYTDANEDQLAWATSQRWINHVSFYRHRSLPLAYELLRRGARRLRGRSGTRPAGVDEMAQRTGATVERFTHPRDLPADAVALLQRAEQSYVEFGADWLALMTDTVFACKNASAEFMVLKRNGRALAVLPIGVQPGERGPEVGALANFYTTLYAPALDADLTPDDLLPLTTALRRSYRGKAAYRFWPMDPESREFRLLRQALRLAGLRPHEYFAFGNWHLQVDGDWVTYLQSRSGQLRSTIKRMTKRLAAEPGGRLEIIRDESDVERGIAAYEAVYAASWKVPEPFPGFVPGLIRLCARRGWLRLGVAWIGDKPIAAQLWIVHASRAHIYKLAYDEAFKALAPGTVLTALLFEEAIDHDRVNEIDYLIGDDAYKKTWMSHRRERHGLIAYDLATPRGLMGLARQGLGNAWRRLRASFQSADNPAS